MSKHRKIHFVAVYIVFVLSFLSVSCGLGKYFAVGHHVAAGDSMSPTIKKEDHFTTFRIKSWEIDPIERFDIVVFNSPISKDHGLDEITKIVARVIALGGEKIEIKKGKVFINDKLIEEPFEKVFDASNFAPIIVPKNEYFMLGDNHPGSWDSRFWKTTIKEMFIDGKVNNIIRKEDWDNGKRW